MFKLRLSLDELTGLLVAANSGRSTTGAPFDIPAPVHRSEQAGEDRQTAIEPVKRDVEESAERWAAINANATLNPATLEIIRVSARGTNGGALSVFTRSGTSSARC